MNEITSTFTSFSSSSSSSSAELRVNQAILAFQSARPVILLDDLDRENEADLICPASTLSHAIMAMLIRDCSGIVCLCLTPERARQLDLPPMVSHNQSRYGTAFTVSIEAREGVTTGVSAADRLATIAAAIHPDAVPADLARPGHVFPLIAHPVGVQGRRGHTEGAIELSRLAGCGDAAVLCELMQPDGTMMRGEALLEFARQHQLCMLSIDDLVQVSRVAAMSI
ncbi:3,4-dihydroxy-2-butanone-4-phosphate synthase [Chitinibacter sp. FCG-7]|uniref:3,4-dihydroxy-2-butanone 4-phosphate synthase n=1 Tax=Chitinibacter mangrovi TaxID=3153927 RepID=A0AAU7F5W3_9NEIS